ncbi:MAG: PQQ-dependent sugar dehydrogenase [Planctomycetota bacterium]
MSSLSVRGRLLLFGLLVGWQPLSQNQALAQTFARRITDSNDITRPVFATAPAGDADRLFVAEQHTGRIEILDLSTGTVSPTPFIDLSGLSTGNEQGLLGFAFDPDYASNGHFYVYVTTSADGGDTHVRRYTANGNPTTATTASLASQFEILSFNQPQGNHNGGWIGFSPNDNYLYIASGDGGGGNDDDAGHTPGIGNGQDITNNLLGKMLRIDVSGDDFPSDANRNYAIPASNPFVNVTGDDEIWSYGLRNPFRASFDRGTGDLWIGDVGQGRREEIDFQPASSPGGENYGWRLREGTIQTPGSVGGPPPVDHVEPIYDYEHLASVQPDPTLRGNVVIGGYVYRGPVEAFQGHYFFVDAGSNNFWTLDPDAIDPAASVRQINSKLAPSAGNITSIGSFAEDDAGNLYFMETFGNELFMVDTNSEVATWNGTDPTAGAAGNGTVWSTASNWTRGTTTDQVFVSEDAVVFAAGSTANNINLNTDRIVASVAFEAGYTLQNRTLRVLSGNVSVEPGIVAIIESDLVADTSDHSVRKLGGGTLIVDGNVGQTVVKDGTLGGQGMIDHLTVLDGATVAPGASAGTLSITNTLTFEAGSTLAIELGGTGIGEFDQLLVGGVAMLAGTLDVDLLNGFVPQAGDSFGFLAASGGAGGVFDTLDLPVLGPNLEWVLNPGGVTVSLFVNSTLQADFDNDGDVDSDDLGALQTNFGLAGGAGRAQGDADGDLDVDGTDFLLWQSQFDGTAASSAAPGSVPEPNSPTMLALCASISLVCRLRHGLPVGS